MYIYISPVVSQITQQYGQLFPNKLFKKFSNILLAQNYIQNIFVAKFSTISDVKFKIFLKIPF